MARQIPSIGVEVSISAKRVFAAAVVTVVVSYGVSTGLSGQATPGRSTAAAEWGVFGADRGATRYPPANQINAPNVRNLQVAWRFSTRNFGPRPPVASQVSPLIIDGVMYTTAGMNRDVAALDAATGQLLWQWRPTGELTRWADIIDPLSRSTGRGVSYWTDGRGDERIFVVMPSYMLVALDARTGRQVRASAPRASSTSPRTCGGTSGLSCRTKDACRIRR